MLTLDREYQPRYDAPVVLTHPGMRAGLAVEDRNLRAEAMRHDACICAALEVYSALYPARTHRQ